MNAPTFSIRTSQERRYSKSSPRALRHPQGARLPSRRLDSRVSLVLALPLLFLLSCDGSVRTPTGPEGPSLDLSRSLTIVSGDGQSADPGTTLEPFVVRVVGSSGAPAVGVDVLWTLIRGEAELIGERIQIDGEPGEAVVTTTDEEGLAAVSLRIRAEGEIEVEASVFFGESSVIFSAAVDG